MARSGHTRRPYYYVEPVRTPEEEEAHRAEIRREVLEGGRRAEEKARLREQQKGEGRIGGVG